MVAWRLLVGSFALALVALNSSATAQGGADWPNKTVRLVVNFAAGGSADNTARPFAERLTKALGQQFVVENRGGATGALGLEGREVGAGRLHLRVTPSFSLVILPHLRKTPYDPLKDLVPVSLITDATLLFAVHPSVPAKRFRSLWRTPRRTRQA